jgi:5'-deoxynucleotidase YfbR-like HD superfamily hydrolase
MNTENIRRILDFAKTTDRQKHQQRYSHVKSDAADSVAAHTDSVMTRAVLLARELARQGVMNLDLSKVMLIAWAHDKPEVLAGEMTFARQMRGGAAEKKANEESAVAALAVGLSEEDGEWFADLWKDYAGKISIEAKFVNVIDKIDAFYTSLRIGLVDAPEKMDGTDTAISVDGAGRHLYKCYGLHPALDELINYVAGDAKEYCARWKAANTGR